MLLLWMEVKAPQPETGEIQELIISSDQVISRLIFDEFPLAPISLSPGLVPASLLMPKKSIKNGTRDFASIILLLGKDSKWLN